MNVNFNVDGKRFSAFVDAIEFSLTIMDLNKRRKAFFLVMGLPYEKYDYLVEVLSYRDVNDFVFVGKRVFVSTRGVKYRTAFY
jgi:hypothetical protein